MSLKLYFQDHYVQEPMQKIVADRLRPAGQSDPFGVEQAKSQLHHAHDVVEQAMASETWAVGEHFSIADCAAAPALFYANTVAPFGASLVNLPAYLGRLMARASVRPRARGSAALFQPVSDRDRAEDRPVGRTASGRTARLNPAVPVPE